MGKRIEIGSFLELDLKRGSEYYSDESNIARLNTGRSGIIHSLQLLHCKTIYLPYYLCPDVRTFISRFNITIKYYNISPDFEPLLENNEEDSAILIVNYFGLLPESKLKNLKLKYSNVIIDNCSAFFMPPIKDTFNVYSCRKFFGVPDGCYVIGPGAGEGVAKTYAKDFSSDTSLFLLKRIEVGSSASYRERMKNEERLDNAGILRMSDLTIALLSGLDYLEIRTRRKANFDYAVSIFKEYNLLDMSKYWDKNTLPMFYPLVVRDILLVDKLKAQGIFTGRRWAHVVKEVMPGTFEEFISNYMVPIPIDQRYGEEELDYCLDVIQKLLR